MAGAEEPRPPRVLLVGASGFIGSAVQRGLKDAGCEVVPASRRPASGGIAVDLTIDVHPSAWAPRLAGIDVVVNAAGAFQDTPGNELASLHEAGPRALFEAAAQANVRRVIQLSALGADSAATRYFATKMAAERHLMQLPVPSVILRPSLVFGPGGRSASVMLAVASLPWMLLPRAFRSSVQPVHVDDLVVAVVRLVHGIDLPESPVAAVGAKPSSLRDFLQSLRHQLGFPRARTGELPGWMIRIGAWFPPLARTGLLSAEAMKMLEAGSTADPRPFAQLLGRQPRDVSQFIPPGLARPLATEATLTWTLPLLCASIAALWILTGIISLGIYPVEQSYALLARLGIGPALQPLMLYGAALFDIALGVAVLLYGGRPLVWRLQIALVLLYTVLITIWLPEFWLHPFGPLTKNIPLLASFYMLQRLAVPRWNT